MINDFFSQNQKQIFVKAAKSFLDDYQEYQLQLDGNIIEANNDYKPPEVLNDGKKALDQIIDVASQNLIEENPKKSLSKNVKKMGDDIENIEDLFGSEDKIALKKKLKKMMKLLDNLDDNAEEEEKNGDKKVEVEEKNGGKKEENDKKYEEIIKISSNEEFSDKSINNEAKINDMNENEVLKPNLDDFSILDSPTNMEKDISRNKNNLRDSKANNNQGSIAKNRKGEWDKIKILDTSNWPDLCKNGQQQSPIRIKLSSNYHIEPFRIDIDYHEPEEEFIELLNDGMKLFVKGSFGALQYGDHFFQTREIHLHHPSEHTFGDDEVRTDLEVQIVNEDNSGLKIVVSLFLHDFNQNEQMEIADSQKFIRAILGISENYEEEDLGELDLLNEGKKRKIPKNENMNLGLLLPQIENYITYYGSITTPPCQEGVKWVIIRQKISVTKFEIKALKTIFGKESNVRGLQDIGNREISMF